MKSLKKLSLIVLVVFSFGLVSCEKDNYPCVNVSNIVQDTDSTYSVTFKSKVDEDRIISGYTENAIREYDIYTGKRYCYSDWTQVRNKW